MKFNAHTPSKMKELILHVATESESDEKFGAVKLNKILFYADFLSYLRRGKSITGQVYFALGEGPAPKCMLPVQKEMESNKEIAMQKIDMGAPKPMHRVVPLRSPDYSKLDAEDLVFVNFVIKKFQDFKGSDLSGFSHDFSGWRIAMAKGGEKTEIPYSSVLFDTEGFWSTELPPISEQTINHGKKLAEQMAQSEKTQNH